MTTTIDKRVLQIAELAWAITHERNGANPDEHTDFQHYLYEETTEFLISLDQEFKAATGAEEKS